MMGLLPGLQPGFFIMEKSMLQQTRPETGKTGNSKRR